MSDSNHTGAIATMLCAKLDSLNITLSLPDARYQRHKKKIKISIDDKVVWSYKWTNTFAPSLGKDLVIPLSSIVEISLIVKHHIRDHLLGKYSGRIIEFLLDKDKPLTLQGDRLVSCATITVGLSPVVDYQEALNACVDARLAQLDNNPKLVEGLDNVDQAVLLSRLWTTP
ncbi:hypothetical protein BDN67DRAFT_1017584 [Paxillus ammoniavirescens]|nr:hypothetical protein BDN67DRAFT_1017584 [Paxillus ammoniavirescens]